MTPTEKRGRMAARPGVALGPFARRSRAAALAVVAELAGASGPSAVDPRASSARDYARQPRHHGRVVHAVAPGALTTAALDLRVAPQRGRARRRPFRSWRRLAGEPLRSAAHTEPTLHARVSPL